ncbi:MAG: hypothetical protein HY097_01200 [Nitrospinae bacterium]|nr:hypothetical protein [Nitrospinota bacterium]
MFSSEEGDKGHQEEKGNEIVLEDEGQITFGISHIIVTFFATLIGTISGLYLSQR